MNQPLRLAMYLRKSSEAEDRQQLSIPAQERELRELATRQGLRVVGEPVAEAMSAKRPGRPGFAELVKRIERREADGILVWALDRLARNPIDGGAIMWALGERQIQAIVASDRTYTGSGDDKLLMSIIFGMATKYSDDLSKNIKRGNRQALISGRWPGKVPIGYVRERDKSLAPDPERWHLVRRMWELRLSGVCVAEIFRRANEEWRFRTPQHGACGNRPLTLSELYRIFDNRFYAGYMRLGGTEEYLGNHPPMVTDTEFLRVRGLTQARMCRPAEVTYPFGFRRLLQCGSCGAMVTAELKVNRYGKRYVYYHCARKSRSKGYCPEPSIDEMQHLLKANATAAHVAARKAQFAQTVSRADQALINLRRMRAEGEIDEAAFYTDQQHYHSQRAMAQKALSETDSSAIIEPSSYRVSLLREAKSRFAAADFGKRHEFLLELTSKCLLKGKKVLITAKEPFESLRKGSRIPSWYTLINLIIKTFQGMSKKVYIPDLLGLQNV